jgi:hypothetical protein
MVYSHIGLPVHIQQHLTLETRKCGTQVERLVPNSYKFKRRKAMNFDLVLYVRAISKTSYFHSLHGCPSCIKCPVFQFYSHFEILI